MAEGKERRRLHKLVDALEPPTQFISNQTFVKSLPYQNPICTYQKFYMIIYI